MQPKNDKKHYKAREAQEKLGMTYSALRHQVNIGNLKSITPPSGKQAVYLKEEVDNLARELNIFLATREEEIDIINFASATEADIFNCIALNRELFTVSTIESDITLAGKWAQWIRKNPEVVYVLKRNKEIVGIATMLPFKSESKKFDEILMGDTSILLGNINISQDDIEEYKPGNHVQLYVAEIGIKPSLDKDLRRKYGAKLISKFMDSIANLGNKGVIIDKIIAVGATRSGIRLLQHFGFSEITFPRPDTRVFVIDMEKSGAPVIRAYREALHSFQQSTHLQLS